MVAAWMFAASCGILFARYFRLTWVGKQFKGKDYWFVVSALYLNVWGNGGRFEFVIIYRLTGF